MVQGFCSPDGPGSPSPSAGDQRSSVVNESSSLLGGSPRRQCSRKGSPYHTGQLHPAVRVADLLQHINQMKTAEGYGFKQEYEVRASCAGVSGRAGGRMDKVARVGPVCKEKMLQTWSCSALDSRSWSSQLSGQALSACGVSLGLDQISGPGSSGFVSLNKSLR